MKGKEKSPKRVLNKIEAGNISDIVFKVVVIRMLKELSKNYNFPGLCGSVDCAPAYKPKGLLFNSQSEHMPGLQAVSPVGGSREAITH